MLWLNTQHFDMRDYEKTRKAIATLSSIDWEKEKLGKREVDEDVFAQVLAYDTESIENFQFEVHHHRMDIHYVVEGEEIIEVSVEHPREVNYLSERDLAYVEKPKTYSQIVMHEGDMLIIGMDEPHRTNGVVGDESARVKKVVLKMRH